MKTIALLILYISCFIFSFLSWALPKDKSLQQKMQESASKVESFQVEDTTVYLTEIEQWSQKLDELLAKSRVECASLASEDREQECRERLTQEYKNNLKAYFASREKFFQKILSQFHVQMQEQQELMLKSQFLLPLNSSSSRKK